MVALPILFPSLLGTLALLFANAFGAVATAIALTGSSLNIAPILLFAQIRGDVLGDPHLGYALAFGMIVITGIANFALHLAPRPLGKVAEMKRFAAWAALLLGLLYFLMPLLGMTEFSLKMRRGVYSLDAYAKVLNDPQFPGRPSPIRSSWRCSPSSSACCWWCRPPTGCG